MVSIRARVKRAMIRPGSDDLHVLVSIRARVKRAIFEETERERLMSFQSAPA